MITVKRYAGVGARKTPIDVLHVMRAIGRALARDGYTVHTGAAVGADQAFAEGAMSAGLAVNLFLPWATYERDWVNSLIQKQLNINVLKDSDREAFESVNKYHPNPHTLSNSVIRLHARNFCILRQCEFLVCWTPQGLEIGGTGQALRIAEAQGQMIWNLGKKEVLDQFIKRLTERGEL